MNNSIWRECPAPPIGFADTLGFSPFKAHLLYNRGVRDQDTAAVFLNGDAQLLHDPMMLPDMATAVSRLLQAVERRETVAIYGDFDTDGITAVAILVHTLRELGISPMTYIPDRTEEGHGLNETAIKSLAADGVSVLVTVDTGTTSVEEIAVASSLGIDVIVTDHHLVDSELPAAEALVNPNRPNSTYPFPELTGSGLAFKLAQALLANVVRPIPSRLWQLAALGTVADVGTMIGENRILVRLGIAGMKQTSEPGIAWLAKVAKVDLQTINSDTLSFRLIPRLNAAGRLGHASISLDLLTTNDREQARRIADTLDRLNSQRQKITEEAMVEARHQVSTGGGNTSSVIMVGHQDWIPGILGLIASRLSDEHNRPVVAMKKEKKTTRASARSIDGVDIHAVLDRSGVEFLRFGGHAQAAGFTIDNRKVDQLKNALAGRDASVPSSDSLRHFVKYDCQVPLSILSEENVSFIESLGPHGTGNPEPLFLSRDIRVIEARVVGIGGRHLKLRVAGQEKTPIVDAIAFGQGANLALLQNRVDLLYSVGMNTWNGQSRMQLRISEFRPSTL